MNRSWIAGAAGASALLVLAGPARSELIVSVSDGSDTYTATDASSPGKASYSGEVGAFKLSLDTGLGYPLVGALGEPVVELSSLDLSTGARGGTLTVAVTETGFKDLASVLSFLSSLTGT